MSGLRLTSLPLELLSRIFVLAQTPSLAYVSQSFHTLSQSSSLRAHYLLHRYGYANALGFQAFRLNGVLTTAVIDILLSLGADPSVDDGFVVQRLVNCGENDLTLRIVHSYPAAV